MVQKSSILCRSAQVRNERQRFTVLDGRVRQPEVSAAIKQGHSPSIVTFRVHTAIASSQAVA